MRKSVSILFAPLSVTKLPPQLRKVLPSLFTFLNLACGYCIIVYGLAADPPHTAWVHRFLWLAVFFDFMDGLLARQLKAISSFGKQLDALSDLVSFGLVPALYYHHLFQLNNLPAWAPLSLLVLAAAAYRLARFNAEAPTTHFKGLPSPAHALFVTAWPLTNPITEAPYALHELVVVLVAGSALMVTRMQFLSLKGIIFSGWRRTAVLSLFLSVFFVSLFRPSFFLLLMALYVALSLLRNKWNTGRRGV